MIGLRNIGEEIEIVVSPSVSKSSFRTSTVKTEYSGSIDKNGLLR